MNQPFQKRFPRQIKFSNPTNDRQHQINLISNQNFPIKKQQKSSNEQPEGIAKTNCQ
jgi:hypothetical protein